MPISTGYGEGGGGPIGGGGGGRPSPYPGGRPPRPGEPGFVDPRATTPAPTPGTTTPATTDPGWQETLKKYAQRYGPIAAQLIGLYISSRVGSAAQRAAMQRSPEELLALAGATGAAQQSMNRGDEMFGAGKQLTGQGMGYLQGPANYYQTLLSGNRAAMSNVVSPAVAQITGQYRGAQRQLQHSGVRGAAREQQAGELNRQKASQISGLTTGIQPAAAAGLAGLGSQALGAAAPMYSAGASLYGAGGNIYRGLLGDAYNNRTNAQQVGRDTGKAAAETAVDIGELIYGMFNNDPKKAPTTGAPTSGAPTNTNAPPPAQRPGPPIVDSPMPTYPGGPAPGGGHALTAPTGRMPSWGSSSPFGAPASSPFDTVTPTNRWRF